MYFKRKAMLTAFAVAVFTHQSAQAGILTDNMIYDLVINVPNPIIDIDMQNTSDSVRLTDFEIGYSADELTFTNLTTVMKCGYSQYETITNYRRKTYANKEFAQVWLGKGGTAALHDMIPGDYYDGSRYPDVIPETWELKNALFKDSLELVGREAQAFDIKIPISSLKHPKDGAALPIDGESIFNRALTKHVEEGGDRLEFFKQDKIFTIDVPMTFSAPCQGRQEELPPEKEAGDFDSTFKFYDFEEVMITINYHYKGDPKLKYTPKVDMGSDGGLLSPILIENASISVNPPVSTGACPRNVTAKALIELSDVSSVKRKLRYRFLENGKPATLWKEKNIHNLSELELTHSISVTAPQSQNKGTLVGSIDAIDNGTPVSLGDKPSLNHKPVVAIELQLGGQTKIATTQYEAYCSKIKKAYLDPNYFSDKVDLVLRGHLLIGEYSAPWGETLELSMEQASDISPRGCEYRYAYDILNVQKGDASQFTSALSAGGKVLKQNPLPGLAGQDTQIVSGTITLPAGQYKIFGEVDTLLEVDETVENNNKASLKLIVPQECGGSIRD